MKQESTKKSKLWLWIVIGVVLLAAIVGTVLALLLGGQEAKQPDTSGRPELYWNVDRAVYTDGSESGLSTREPGEDGLYHIRFAIDGEHVELAAADKQLVNFIDMQEVLALTVDADGVIVSADDPKTVATVIGKGLYAQKAEGDKVLVNSSLAMNGMVHELTVNDLTQIYEVSGEVEPVGKIVDSSAIQTLDTVGVYANGDGVVTHIFIINHPARSSIYWRAEQFFDSTLKQTTRVPDKDGVYTFEAYCDGELVTLKTKDRDIVNTVDRQDKYACSNGFLFDEEGFVIEEIDPGLGTRTILGCERFDITEIVGNTIYTAKLWNNDGSTFSCEIADDCIIYDVSTAALAEGRRGKQVDSVQVGDRVTVWTDADGKAAYIYVACRTVDTDIYYVPTRKYDSTLKETTRTPNSEGYYTVELLKVGENANRTFKTKDKALMSYLDSITAKAVGLKLNGDIIEIVYDSECLFGYTPLTRGGTIPSVSGSIFTRMTYGKTADDARTSVMAPECKVYNVSEVGTYGAETTLQPYDRVYAHKQPTGEAICIFVTQRRVGLDHLYWNMERLYDSTAKTTTRTPDENGWYVFKMIHQGKQVTLKTKSKSVATKIDAQSSCAVGLDVSGDVIVNYYSALNTSGGSVTMSGYRVKEIRSDGSVVVYYGSGDTYKERSFKIKSDGVIYNVSDAYYSYKGEKVSSLKKGDMVLVVTDIYAEAEVVYVRYREADNMYWRTDRFYDTVNKVTTRVPDSEGWYHYDLAVNGAVKSYKTKDKDLATKIDAVSGAFGLVVDGDVIRSYVPTNWVKNVGFVGVTSWEVTAINGSSITVKYQLPGSSNTGKTQTITLASGAKIYDVSATAKSFGAATKLQVGDQIRTYQNEANTAHLYVYVMHRANRAQGIDGYCAHCDKTVHWNPYAGGSITRASGHYYLTGNCETAEQLGVGLEGTDYEIVLDLNGKTLTRLEGGRFALVRFGDTLTVMDSVGGGAIKSHGADGYNGGVLYVNGGNVNLMGGTLELVKHDFAHKWGGVLYLGEGSTFTMSGGTLLGGNAQRGGSIYNTGESVIEMSGGTISGGHCTKESGGNIYLMGGTTMKMTGGTIENGTSVGRGGNVHIDSAVFEVTGGTITGGTSDRSADGICINSSKSSVKLVDVNCGDKILVRYMGEFVVGGSVKIAELEIPAGKVFTVGEMNEGSEIFVNTVGAFTKEFENAQAYVDAGYFKSAIEDMEVDVSENALAVVGGKVYCDHCEENVAWIEWSGESKPASGHYYIADDYTAQTAQLTISAGTDVVLDLKGNAYTTSGIRNFLVSGIFSVVDTVGGGTMAADGANNDGTIAYINGAAAEFRLYGGTLMQGNAPQVNNGGLLAANRGAIRIMGGTLQGGTVAGEGSAIWNKRHVALTIDNAVVTGSVYIVGDDESKASVVMNNATVDTVKVGDKVDVTVCGKTVVSNLDLTGGKLITLGELTEGADITVTADDGVFTAENPNAADYEDYFAEISGKKISTVENKLAAGEVTAEPEPEPDPEPETFVCPHCGKTEAELAAAGTPWSEWPNANKPASGHYYISSDYSGQTAQWTISNDVVLDLRGNTYSTTGIRNFIVSGTFSIVDSVDGGRMVSGGKNTSTDGTIAYVNGGAVFNLYSGTLEGGTARNGGVLCINKGTVNIHGGSLIEGNVTGNGSTVSVTNYGNVNITGGTASGNIYVKGAADNQANLTISGGTMNRVQVGDEVNVTVSGAPVIANLDLTGGKRITLGELITGADIKVTADIGAFTVENTKASDYADYFDAADTKQQVIADGNFLCIEESEITKYNGIYAKATKMTEDGVFAEGGTVTAQCPHCGEDAQWEPLKAVEDRDKVIGTHHYFLAGDLENIYYYYFGNGSDTAEGAQICLHLNGHSIRNTLADTSDNARAIYVETDAVLNIMGEGTVAGAGKQVKRGAVDVRGILNLYGGNYESTSTKYPVIQVRYSTAEVNVFQGSRVGTENMDATGIYLQLGTVNVYGGTLWGKTDILENTAVTLAGAPVISLLDLTSGVKVTLGELTDGANITADAEGVFAEGENANTYAEAEYIKAVEGKQITAEGNTLSMTATLLQTLAAFLNILSTVIL